MSDIENSNTNTLQRNLPVIGAAVRNIIIFTAVLSIPLTAAQALELTPSETTSWIFALYGVPAILSLILTFRYRLPLLVTGNLFVIIFINGLGGETPYEELIGAAVVAGLLVVLIGVLGLSKWLASLIPIPIMFGLLAGAVLPFVSGFFTEMGNAPVIVGGTLLVYLISRRFAGERVPAILPALITGVLLTAITGQFQQPAEPISMVLPQITIPIFSLQTILTATPVLVVLITIQANLPSMRFLHSQDYQPPEMVVDTATGLGTMFGSLFGPTGASLSLPATSIAAGPEAGEHDIRHRAVIINSFAALLLGSFAGIAAGIAGLIPAALLITLAGLAVVDVLGRSLQQITQGPLFLGPVFAFAIALSDISFLGFNNYFWSLVIGTLISLLLEREGLRKLHEQSTRKD